MPDSLPRYENPLDLLQDLLRQQQIPLATVSLAPITSQYLEYMRRAEALDLNLGIEFAHTAAVLIHLKSKALLPEEPGPDKQPADSASELIRQLFTREEARRAAELLVEKKLSEAVYHAPERHSESERNSFSLWDLTEEFRALAKLDWNQPPVYIPEMEGPGVDEMIHWLDQRLPYATVSLANLLSEQPTRRHQAALFLAVLESARSGGLRIGQNTPFAPVLLDRQT